MPHPLLTVLYAGRDSGDASRLTATLQPHGDPATEALATATIVVANGPLRFPFKALGGGWYSFAYHDYPDGCRAAVVFAYGGRVLACVAINPQESEYADVPASTVGDLIAGRAVEGSVVVDQNYGGPGLYTIVDGVGAAVQGAEIRAYLADDYAALRRGPAYVRSSTRTAADGTWATAMMLTPGLYTLLIYKPGRLGPVVAPLVVA